MKIYIDKKLYDFTSQWYSYAYYGIGSHQYLACHYAESDGFNGNSYITADDSLWTIDTPEEPESILALIIPSMLELKLPPLDLCNVPISFSLRGDNLKLYGAKCYFWIVTFLPMSTRWHYVSQPLHIPEGQWSELQTLTLIPNNELWHRSFALDEPSASLKDTLGLCMSFGFSFVGFSEKVTGKFSLSDFTIHQNLDTRKTYFANFHKFNKWLALNRSRGCQVSAPIDVYGRVIMLNDDNYVVLATNYGIAYVYLTFIKRIDSIADMQLQHRTVYFMLGWKEMSPKPAADYKQGNMYFFIENTLSNTIWVFKQPIHQSITLGSLLLEDNEDNWFRLTGNAPLGAVMAGGSDKFGYDYFGFMLIGVKATPTGYWTLAEFSIT